MADRGEKRIRRSLHDVHANATAFLDEEFNQALSRKARDPSSTRNTVDDRLTSPEDFPKTHEVFRDDGVKSLAAGNGSVSDAEVESSNLSIHENSL